jgi:hypothetical protein
MPLSTSSRTATYKDNEIKSIERETLGTERHGNAIPEYPLVCKQDLIGSGREQPLVGNFLNPPIRIPRQEEL